MMQRLLISIAAACAQLQRFDFTLDGAPLSGNFERGSDLWQTAAEFVAVNGWTLAPDSRACARRRGKRLF